MGLVLRGCFCGILVFIIKLLGSNPVSSQLRSDESTHRLIPFYYSRLIGMDTMLKPQLPLSGTPVIANFASKQTGVDPGR